MDLSHAGDGLSCVHVPTALTQFSTQTPVALCVETRHVLMQETSTEMGIWYQPRAWTRVRSAIVRWE